MMFSIKEQPQVTFMVGPTTYENDFRMAERVRDLIIDNDIEITEDDQGFTIAEIINKRVFKGQDRMRNHPYFLEFPELKYAKVYKFLNYTCDEK